MSETRPDPLRLFEMDLQTTSEEELRRAREDYSRFSENKEIEEKKLIKNIADRYEELQELFEQCNSHWGYEDPVYRFYHQSFKVYGLQEATQEIVNVFQSLAPHLALHKWFRAIVAEGTGKEFKLEDNENWTAITRPIVEAFFHARYFLEMMIRYGKELKEPPSSIPSGWASVLYLYHLR